MSSYRYQELGSALEEISIRKTAGGGVRAFLFAREDITPEQVAKIKKKLEEKHFSCVANEENGKTCLEVRGFKDHKTLDNLLRTTGLVKGTVNIDHSDNEKFSLGESFRNNMVSIYGVINIIADGFLFAYGKMKEKFDPDKKQWEDKAAACSYLAGSSMFTLFGRGDKSDYQVRDIALDVRKEMEARGIELSPESAAVSFSSPSNGQNTFNKTCQYLSKRGSDAGNIATGTAGALIAKGALKGKNSMDTALGAVTVVSGYGAALVKEKAPDPDHPPENMYEKVKQWVQEKPNRLAGYGYMISTIIHGEQSYRKYMSAGKEYPDKIGYVRKAYTFRGIFTGLNIVGEFILAAASKGRGNGSKSNTSLEDTVLAITADAIVRQPVAKRDELINDFAKNFLAGPHVLGGDAETMQAKLYQKVHKLEQTPWFSASSKTSSSANETVAKIASVSTTDKTWAENKVKAMIADASKAASHKASVESSRASSQQLTP